MAATAVEKKSPPFSSPAGDASAANDSAATPIDGDATDTAANAVVADAVNADAVNVDTAAVAECESTGDAVRAACVAENPTDGRLCVYDAIRPLCATGRTAFVSGLFHCLLLDPCQTPSDPSSARDCEAQLIASNATPEIALLAPSCVPAEMRTEPGATRASLRARWDST